MKDAFYYISDMWETKSFSYNLEFLHSQMLNIIWYIYLPTFGLKNYGKNVR